MNAIYVNVCKNNQGKNYYDILLVTENIKVATKCNGTEHKQQQKKEEEEEPDRNGSKRKRPTKWDWLSLCQFYLLNDLGLFICLNPSDFYLLTKFYSIFPLANNLSIASAFILVQPTDELPLRFYIHTGINKMSAPEYTKIMEHFRSIVYVSWVDSKLMVLFADTTWFSMPNLFFYDTARRYASSFHFL